MRGTVPATKPAHQRDYQRTSTSNNTCTPEGLSEGRYQLQHLHTRGTIRGPALATSPAHQNLYLYFFAFNILSGPLWTGQNRIANFSSSRRFDYKVRKFAFPRNHGHLFFFGQISSWNRIWLFVWGAGRFSFTQKWVNISWHCPFKDERIGEGILYNVHGIK